jgi:hypothetical protein
LALTFRFLSSVAPARRSNSAQARSRLKFVDVFVSTLTTPLLTRRAFIGQEFASKRRHSRDKNKSAGQPRAGELCSATASLRRGVVAFVKPNAPKSLGSAPKITHLEARRARKLTKY